jgi:hypothetical protein
VVESVNPPSPSPHRVWLGIRVILVALVATLVAALLVWSARLVHRGIVGERIPDDAEVLSDEAVRVDDTPFITKASLALPGGGVLQFEYGPISDSGVKLRRLDLPGGVTVWEQACDCVGVDHSKYRHEVVVHLEGNTAKVISRGSYGAFVERLDLDTGRSLARSVRKPDERESIMDRVRRWLGLTH